MKSCEDCGYYKCYINRRKMQEFKTDQVIWLELCEHLTEYGEIKSLDKANECKFYDDDSWMK